MSSKAWKEGRCGECGKPADDDVHRTEKEPSLFHKLLHLAWPRWTWQNRGRHAFADRDAPVKARENLSRMGRELKRRRRRGV